MRFVISFILIFGSVNSQFQNLFGQFQSQTNQNGLNPFGFQFPSQFSQNHAQTLPQNYGQQYPQQSNNQNYGFRPPNTSTNRPNVRPTTSTPSQNKRISEQKCAEYIEKAKNSVLVGSLSFIPSVHGVQTDQCDGSTGLIVGGENAMIGEFPHMAAIGYQNDFDNIVHYQCGGSLISDRYVLTAAHCREADRVKPSIVRLGALNIKIKEAGQMDVQIESFTSHEKYNPDNSKNDIAVIRLKRNVSFTRAVRPACLNNIGITIKNKKPIATGWGLTESFTDKTSDIMQKVGLNIIDINQCIQIYNDPDNFNLDNTQLCAGELEGGKDTCQGDSGGPLQVASDKNKCVYIIIGITSYGQIDCGAKNAPGVYTRISSYIGWIEQKVWGS